MAVNRSDKSRILRRYFPGMTRDSEMSTEPKLKPRWNVHLSGDDDQLGCAGASPLIRQQNLDTPQLLHIVVD